MSNSLGNIRSRGRSSFAPLVEMSIVRQDTDFCRESTMIAGTSIGRRSWRRRSRDPVAADLARNNPNMQPLRNVWINLPRAAVKLCNQLVCGMNIQAICEALALGRASGVDLPQLREVLLGGSAASWMLDKLGSAMIAGDDKAGFRIDLMLKDLRLVQEHANALSVPLPGTALVTSQYVDARAHGEGGNGNQALFRVYDRMTNQRG